MADQDDTNVDEQEDTEVDATKSQDEPESEEDQDTTSETDEGDQDNDADAAFKKRYTQFKGDNPLEYIENLEQGYGNSSNEALKWKKIAEDLRAEKLTEVANADDESKPAASQPESMTDALVAQMKRERDVEHYNKFASKHPEVNEDNELFNQLDAETGKYMDYVYKTEKRVPGLDEALDFAWQRVAPNDSSSKEEKVVSAVKNAGSTSKTKGVSKDAVKPQFSEKQIETARRLDPTLADKSRSEIETILAKYKK